MEGELKKRGATMPVMHDRYCVATWEIDQAFNKYVLLRSFKSRKSFLKHPTKPLSACTLKCFGDWDGKGTFRRYEHAFLMETREGRVFLCAAPNALEKTRWLEFMSNKNPAPSRGNSSSELRQLMRPSSSSTLNGGIGGNGDGAAGTGGAHGLSLNHRLSLQFLEESESQGGSLSIDGSDDGQYGGDLHSDTYSEYSPDEDPGCDSPKSESGSDKTESKPARKEGEDSVVSREDKSVPKPAAEAGTTVMTQETVDATEAVVEVVKKGVEVEENQGAEPISASTPVEIPTTTLSADVREEEQVETSVVPRASASTADAETEEESPVKISNQPEPLVALVKRVEEVTTTSYEPEDQKLEVTEVNDEVALEAKSEPEPEEESKPSTAEMMPLEPLMPVVTVRVAAVQEAQPVVVVAVKTVAAVVESVIEEPSIVPEPPLPVAELTPAPASLMAALSIKIPELLGEADIAPSTPKKTSGDAASSSSPVVSDDGSSTSGDEDACFSPPPRVRSYSTSLTPLDASSTPTQRLRRYSFGSVLAPVRASHVFAAMGSPIKPNFMEHHLGYVQSGLSTMVPSFPELLTSLSRQQSLEVQSEEDEEEEEEDVAQETQAVSGVRGASDIVEV